MKELIDKIAIGQRIKRCREMLEMSQISFSQALNVKQQTISQIENGSILPSFEILVLLAEKYGVSYQEIIDGRKADKDGQNVSLPSELVSVPITDISVAAGMGNFNEDYVEIMNTIQLPPHLVRKGKHLCVKIKGHSMSPTLQDGGFVIIRQLEHFEWEKQTDERIFVITTKKGEAFIKRLKLRFKKDFVVCMSDNPDKFTYPNFNLDINDINTLWYAEWYLSAKMPNIHEQYYERLQRLEDEVDEIKRKLG